jgi:DNA-binding LacI/PurR family transcriptional regulator
MRKKKVTLQDIADKAELSTASVSMIISGKKLSRFSRDTIDRVTQITKELEYKTRKQKDTRYSDTIIIICPSVYNPYYATLIQGMEMQAFKLGLRTIIRNTYWDMSVEEDIFSYAQHSQIAAIVFAMIPQMEKLALELCKNFPMVAVGDYNDNLKFDTIDLNNFDAGRKVARHLLNLGHKKIAYISTSLNSYHSARVRRRNGLLEEMKLQNIQEELIVCSYNVESLIELNNVDIEYETGYKLAIECLKDHPEITAIVAINDMVAYGIMDAIIDCGFSIPEDYSVCGFDNIFPSKFGAIGLTTVENYIVERGRRAITLVYSRMQNNEVHDEGIRNVTRIEYSSKLIERKSTSNPRKNN